MLVSLTENRRGLQWTVGIPTVGLPSPAHGDGDPGGVWRVIDGVYGYRDRAVLRWRLHQVHGDWRRAA